MRQNSSAFPRPSRSPVLHLVGILTTVGFILSAPLPSAAEQRPPDVILFGSCARQSAPQPVWNTMATFEPDAFVFLGDNIYISNVEPAEYAKNYALLGAQPRFEEFRSGIPHFLAIWDDHDFGMNDAGSDNPNRHAAKDAFLKFFRVPGDSPRHSREGLYDAAFLGPPDGPRVQVILLDTRWFRSPLAILPEKERFDIGKYGPNRDPSATILGPEQWAWLEARLSEPADLRILASSIQIVPDEHGFEKWANFPAEQRRLYELIASTQAGGVVAISGDRHYSDISKLPAGDTPVPYALHEVTASAMNQSGSLAGEPNRFRLGERGYGRPNFGSLRVDWDAVPPLVTLTIHKAEDGESVMETSFPLSEIAARGTAAQQTP